MCTMVQSFGTVLAQLLEKVTKKLMKRTEKDDEEYFMVLSDEFAQELEENIRPTA